jgi:transcriptional regulator with XRE-family HTH domain
VIFLETFHNRLKSLCQESGLHQAQIARGLGISPQALSYLIVKERKPSFDTIETMAKYFNVTTDYLLGKSNIKVPEPAVTEYAGLEGLKRNLDRCARMNPDLIPTLNRFLGNTLARLDDYSVDVDALLLKAFTEVIKKWDGFIERAVPFYQNSDIYPEKIDKTDALYNAAETIRQQVIDYGKVLIEQAMLKKSNTNNEGETNGDRT